MSLRSRDWKKGETPFCEIKSTRLPSKPGGPVVIILTARGARESDRRDKEDARLERNARRRKGGGFPADWLAFGPFRSDGTPIFS